jgi:hypothetical protein
MTEYQSNSKKDKEAKEKPAVLEPVVTGPVIQKEKSVGRKFKDIFFGGDFKSSVSHVGGDVMLPALRQLIFDIVVEGVKGVVFGDSAYRRRTGPVDYRSRYQYNSPSQLPRDPRSVVSSMTARIPDQRPYRASANAPRREMNQIILYSRSEAENVLERLTDIIDRYETVSVADLYQLLQLESSPIDNKWGWTYLHNTEIRQVREGFLLDLPPVEPL